MSLHQKLFIVSTKNERNLKCLNLLGRLPEDKTKIYELMRKSHACFLLLYLKTFLMKRYNLAESKIQEYSPTDSVKQYDKPATRKNVNLFNPEMTLQELHPEVLAGRDTLEGHMSLSYKIEYVEFSLDSDIYCNFSLTRCFYP